jgi:hypothetical protein
MKIFGSKKNTSQEEHLLKPDSTSSLERDSLRDDAWDDRYFSLILELEEWHSSRYESQALKLLEQKHLETSFEGVRIKYKLSPTGCSFFVGNDDSRIKHSSWKRMGWRKASKMSALPNFFATSEADVQIDRTDY